MPQKRRAHVPAKKTTARKTTTKRKSSKSVVSPPRFSKRSLGIFGLAFAVIGGFFLFRAFAAIASVHYYGELTATKPSAAYTLTTGTGTLGISFSNNTADVTLTVKNKANQVMGTLKSIGKTDVKLNIPVPADTYTFSLSTAAKFTSKKGYSIYISYPTKDVVAPTAIISSPLSSVTVKGIVDFNATVQSAVAIDRAEFYVDGTLLVMDKISPYGVKWDTTKVVNGTHNLTVKSYDISGLMGQASGSVQVLNSVTPPPNTGFDTVLLRPAAGKILIGANAADSGYATAKSLRGKELHIWHDYARSGANFRSSLTNAPTGTIPLVNFKPGGVMGPAEYKNILAGGRDAAIKEAAAAAKAYGKKFFIAPMHEPENDQKTAPFTGDADYAKAWTYIVNMMKANGATNGVYVWNMMGFKNWIPRYDTLYPGDSVVDWIASDPYSGSTNDTLNDFGGGSTKAFYAWALKHNKPMMFAEWGLDSGTAASNATRFFSLAGLNALQTEMPLEQGLVYWSQWQYVLSNYQSQWKAFSNFDQFNFTVPSTVAK